MSDVKSLAKKTTKVSATLNIREIASFSRKSTSFAVENTCRLTEQQH